MQTKLLTLSYADDLTLFAKDHAGAQLLLDIACEIFAFIGIKINPSKTIYARSPAAYNVLDSEKLTLSHLLNKDATIHTNVPIPKEAVIAPNSEFKYLGVHTRFTVGPKEDAKVHGISGISKWNLQFRRIVQVCENIKRQAKRRPITIAERSKQRRLFNA